MQELSFINKICVLCAFFLFTASHVMAQEAVAQEAVARDTVSATVGDTLRLPAKPYESGKATYYSDQFHGRRMSNGQPHSKHEYTCAHRTLPLGTKLLVVNRKNGRSVQVEVTDRGPFRRSMVIDLSRAAAREIDMLRSGVVTVDIYLLDQNNEEQP